MAPAVLSLPALQRDKPLDTQTGLPQFNGHGMEGLVAL